jgi:hypothetical protein
MQMRFNRAIPLQIGSFRQARGLSTNPRFSASFERAVALFGLNVRVTAGAAWRRDNRRVTLVRRWSSHSRVDVRWRAQHSIGLCELVCKWFACLSTDRPPRCAPIAICCRTIESRRIRHLGLCNEHRRGRRLRMSGSKSDYERTGD